MEEEKKEGEELDPIKTEFELEMEKNRLKKQNQEEERKKQTAAVLRSYRIKPGSKRS